MRHRHTLHLRINRPPRPPPSSAPSLRPQEIIYFHQAIRSALASFAEETRALREAGAAGGVTPAQLAALVERHRFIRAVCLFHSASEDEVGGGGGFRSEEHTAELQSPEAIAFAVFGLKRGGGGGGGGGAFLQPWVDQTGRTLVDRRRGRC